MRIYLFVGGCRHLESGRAGQLCEKLARVAKVPRQVRKLAMLAEVSWGHATLLFRSIESRTTGPFTAKVEP